MSETRQPLALSLSFSGSSSPTVSRPLKRRLTTTDASFFTTSATSFKPRPYAPNGAIAPPLNVSQDVRHYRSVESLAISSPIMDPTPDDPTAVFIHPPFTEFPDSHLISDGLSYALLAENPNWFLDPHDFKSTTSTDSNGIPYPPHLEPPRGWCPAKKRDLKSRGADGWPEGEEPRLRCTFCRRTYAGVNAKSMWRRHVFEKHKIAMANRRDGNDRPRGRGSNKENRQLTSQYQGTNAAQSSEVGLNLTPQYFCDTNTVQAAALKSKVHLTSPLRDKDVCGNNAGHPDIVAYPAESLSYPGLATSSPQFLTDSALSTMTPPLSPHLLHSSESSDSQSVTTTSPIISFATDLPSSYDPLLTPSFRHSPGSLPSDQPWKFPSPSHPLHLRGQDLCLTMLGPMTGTPISKGMPLLDASPPTVPRSDRMVDAETGTLLLYSSPQTSLLRSRVQVYERSGRQVNDSPLNRHTRTMDPRNRLASPSKLAETWIADNGLYSSEVNANRTTQDPFDDAYGPWLDLRVYTSPHLLPAAGVDSPVLRSGILPSASSDELGIMRMEHGARLARTVVGDDTEYISPLADSEEILGTPWLSYVTLDEGVTDVRQESGFLQRPEKRRRTMD